MLIGRLENDFRSIVNRGKRPENPANPLSY